jgi:hypothetical protein
MLECTKYTSRSTTYCFSLERGLEEGMSELPYVSLWIVDDHYC